MQFQSTRDPNTIVSSSEAILRGLAPDGGLFVPTAFPKAELEDWKSLSYPELAQKVLAGFLTDYDPAFLGEAAAATYEDAFAGKAGYVQKVHDGLYSLELWHGPTCAFKDYALQLMPKLLVQAKKILGRTETTRILVATSGDTGKAALAGYAGLPGIEIEVFYPDAGTSEIQRLQMATQAGDNVSVYAVNGNFDDAQTGVKRVFGDASVAEELEKRNICLSSANSINWGSPGAADRVLLLCLLPPGGAGQCCLGESRWTSACRPETLAISWPVIMPSRWACLWASWFALPTRITS